MQAEEEKHSKPDGNQKKKAWSGFQCYDNYEQCYTANTNEPTIDGDLKNAFILDTGSTIGGTIMNPNLIANIRESKTSLQMVTNAGTKHLTKKGDIYGFGEAWFDPNQVANIFGSARMEDQYRITYDSSVEKVFNVHTNDGIVKFRRSKDGLYVYRPSAEYFEDVATNKTQKKQALVKKQIF
jgi:hypothetical protein